MEKIRKSQAVNLNSVKINDSFWSEYVNLTRDVVIPYQWEALNDNIPGTEPSHAIKNFKVAAKEESGEFHGMVFQDSDLAKWLEAVGYSLSVQPDKELELLADKAIDLIEKAQEDDGYLNTYFTIKEPGKRWTNLVDCHELYCAGHMMEAAVAYYEATGKRKLLDVMCKLADHIDTVFGTEESKIRGYDGHQEIELALVKLYRASGNEKYLNLAKFFIDERGQKPSFFETEWEKRGRTSHWTNDGPAQKPNEKYHQSHLPVREQTVAVGHAVRAVYMYTAMADIALESGDRELLRACRTLWDNITKQQMYITGGIGSTVHGEAFTFDYDLPNDTVYAETCASIGLIFFAHRMLQIEAKSVYADVMEKALYNTVIGGMSKDGKHFFYVNPLEVWPEASSENPTRHHVKPERQKWFGCACCPPNVARLLASLGQYIYTSNENSIYTHLYIGGEAELAVGDSKMKIIQETDYPWSGQVKLTIASDLKKSVNICLRIPDWCKGTRVKINGSDRNLDGNIRDGYAVIDGVWKTGDTIELDLAMEVEYIQANPKVKADAGKVAIQRGPLVYCLEGADNTDNLSSLAINTNEALVEEYDKDLLGGAVIVKGKAFRENEDMWKNSLYKPFKKDEEIVDFKAIPYYLWANRGLNEMMVWVRYR